MKRLFSVCLCALFLLTAMPLWAFAAEETVTVSGSITWIGDEGHEDLRENTWVDLYQNIDWYGDVEVTAEDNWEYTFTDLEKTLDGEECEYTVSLYVGSDYAVEQNGTDFICRYDPWFLTVAGHFVRTANCDDVFGDGSVRYIPAEKRLVLNNYVYEGGHFHAIRAREDLTVELIGDNRLGVKTDTFDGWEREIPDFGIEADGDVTLCGTGNLEIYALNGGVWGNNVTVNMTGKLTVKEHGDRMAECCLKAKNGSVTVNSGELDLYSVASVGLYSDEKIAINGGKVTIYSGKSTACKIAPVVADDATVLAGETADSMAAATPDDCVASDWVQIDAPVRLPYGNVDGEGEVTAADALLTLQAVTSRVALSDYQQQIANVDGEGGVTSADALMILQYATQKISAFPVQDADDNTGDDNTGDNTTGGDQGLGSGDGVEDILP